MRIRTAKRLAQRIDLNYFKQAHGLRRWRFVLSVAVPVAALAWLATYAVAGNRKPYSAGPVSRAHAFAEMKCEVCHLRDTGFRAHVSERSCVACHDAPPHAANQTTPPGCATCHQEHRGRVELARVSDRFCVDCHADVRTTSGPVTIVKRVGGFPSAHPEFAAVRNGARDPGGLKFNHAVHVTPDGVRGPQGVERLACAACHTPEIAGRRGKRTLTTGLMSPPSYADACARCHPLYFDELIDRRAPHDRPAVVREFVRRALDDHIAQHPEDISRTAGGVRRVPLNFPRPPEPPARTAAEWAARRLAADERLLWNKTCAECHEADRSAPMTSGSVPRYLASHVTARWMTRASFDHAPHLAVQCTDCHAAGASRSAQDVLMPDARTCAACHAPGRGAEAACFECHQYHDWPTSRPVTPAFRIDSFK